tara:strand:+ start:192 stop:353 length:162 start_codon:yes stop_codon:yes gene_type:complete
MVIFVFVVFVGAFPCCLGRECRGRGAGNIDGSSCRYGERRWWRERGRECERTR